MFCSILCHTVLRSDRHILLEMMTHMLNTAPYSIYSIF